MSRCTQQITRRLLAATKPMELLETRRHFSIGDDIGLPLLFVDVPGVASTTVNSPTTKRLDITKATGVLSVNNGGTEVPLSPPAVLEIHVIVNNDGTFNSGVAGIDDMRVFSDADNDGVFDAGETVLLTGEVQSDDFVIAGITAEMGFTVTGGTWKTDANYFLNHANAGVQLDLSGPDGIPVQFVTTFTDYSVKGLLGSIPPDIIQTPGSLSGRVWGECDDDGKYEPGPGSTEKGIGGVTVTLFDSANNVVATTLTAPDGTYTFDDLLPGTYTIVETQPAGYLDGKDSVGTVNGNPRGVKPPASNDRITQITLAAGENGINYNFAELNTSTISGMVYADVDCDGQVDIFDGAIPGVKITLKKSTGETWVTYTDADGMYLFENLRPGTYTIYEADPTGINSGDVDAGTTGGYANDCYNTISCITLACDEDAKCYNFAEKPTAVKCGQAATIAFWQNYQGQKLLKSLNGSADATNLGNWLAATFPNMFGALAGQTNTVVAGYYSSKFLVSGQKLDAQVLAVAFAVYVTDKQLAGTLAGSYGFRIDDVGLGAATISLGSNAAAFGLATNAKTTVYELLQRADERAFSGLLWDLNQSGTISSAEQSYRNMAFNIFLKINETGGID